MEKEVKAGTTPTTKKRLVKFCPRCGSANIYWARGLPQLWSIWECRNCGYYGAFIVEDGMMATKLQEEYAKTHSKQEQKNRGPTEVRQVKSGTSHKQ